MKMTFDRSAFQAAGMDTLRPKDGVMTVILPGAQDLTRVRIEGDEIELHPQRSSAHKLILLALGR